MKCAYLRQPLKLQPAPRIRKIPTLHMIHHISVGTNDIERAKAFYDQLMPLMGFRLFKASDKAAHYGASDIVFSVQIPLDGLSATPGNGVHVAFQAPDRETVRRFYETALANGGRDEGAPWDSRKLQRKLLRRIRQRSRWQQDRSGYLQRERKLFLIALCNNNFG